MNNPITNRKPSELGDDRTIIEIGGRWFQVPNVLIEYVKQLESSLSRVSRVKQVLEGIDAPAYVDPYLGWCANNVDKLRKYPNSFVGIDVEKGCVVLADSDQDEYNKKYRQLDRDYRVTLFQTHTTLFIK